MNLYIPVGGHVVIPILIQANKIFKRLDLPNSQVLFLHSKVNTHLIPDNPNWKQNRRNFLIFHTRFFYLPQHFKVSI